MDNLHLIDYLFASLGALLSVGWFVLFYALRQNAAGVKETAKSVLEEKDKTAALVLSERDKLEDKFRTELKELEKQFTEHRLMIAEKYATTNLVEKILNQITVPLVKEMEEIKGLLNTKVGRREFERHEEQFHKEGN